METRAHWERRLDYCVDIVGVNGHAVEQRRPYIDLPITSIRLSIFKQLNDFHQLDTLLLYKLVEKDIGSVHYGRFRNGLTDVRKSGGYIFCPPLQFQTINADYKRLVYQLTDRGKAVLREHGVAIQEWGNHSSSFSHDWMTGHFIGSLKLAANARYVPPIDIASRVQIDKPFIFRISDDKTLYPDFPVFGFELPDTHRFFIWETDCATETVKQIVDKIKEYLKLDQPDAHGDNYFWHRLKIPNNYLCIATTNEIHMRDIMKGAGKSEIVLYKTVPHFATLDHTPDPMTSLWSEPWERAGYPPFYLNSPEEQ
jgi:hypothetical protein